MGLPREDLLLLTRALKRGTLDLKGVRKALERRAARPIGLLEALHVPDPNALAQETWTPDPAADRAMLDSLRDLLVESGELKVLEWERFLSSFGKTQRVSHPPLAVPMEFDGYTLQWEVARRERGVVYRAKDKDGRDVAIKVFRKDVPVQGEVPRVEGLAYAVAPFEEGETLEARGKHGLKWAVQAAAKAADALRSRTHGALTPWRILVRGNETVAILGLEHAGAVAPSSRAAQYGAGDDVRALGAILYEAITGVPPAGGISPAAREKDVDPSLDRVVAAALSGGYASTGALADDLWRHLNGQPVTAKPTARTAAKSAGGGSRAWLWASAAGLGVAVLATYLATRTPAETPSPAPRTAKAPAPPAAKPAPAVEVPAAGPAKAVPAPAADRPMTADEETALYNACIVADGSKDVPRVIAAANEAVLRGSKKDWPYPYLVRGYTQMEQLDKALEYAVRATASWPDNADFLRLRAETFVFRGQAERALADYQRLHGGRPKELIRETEELMGALEADPKDGRARLLLGVYQYLRRHFDTAAREFTQAIDCGQKRALAWRAWAAAGMDHKPEAARDAKEYLAEFPSDFASDEVRELLKTLE